MISHGFVRQSKRALILYKNYKNSCMMDRDSSSSSLVNTKYVHVCHGRFCGKKVSQYVTNYAAFLENHVDYHKKILKSSGISFSLA